MNKFKELRQEKNLTQMQLSKILNLDQTTISKWELNKALPDTAMLIKLSQFYDVTIDYLLGNDDLIGIKLPTTPASTSSDSYTREERQLIEKYRELNAPGKKLIDTTLNTLLGTTPKSEQHHQQKKNKIS